MSREQDQQATAHARRLKCHVYEYVYLRPHRDNLVKALPVDDWAFVSNHSPECDECYRKRFAAVFPDAVKPEKPL